MKSLLERHRREFLEILTFSMILLGTVLTSLYNYLLYHTIAELFSIVVAWSIFIIAWNSRKNMDNSFFLVLGVSSLFVGFIDLIHTLAYSGMGIFLEYDANLPTQLWIAARYLQAFSLLLASKSINKNLNLPILISVYLIVCTFLLISIFLRVFPNCYVEGSGLTPFKIISEYIIIVLLFISIIQIFKMRAEFDKKIYFFIIGSIIVTMLAELAFTFYISVYGISNLIGHLFKIFAFYLLYKAIIQIGLENPVNLLFRKLKKSEEEYREAYDRANFYKDIFTHDISNIIQNIASSLQVRKLYKDDAKILEDSISSIEENIQRGSNLIANIRKLSNIEEFDYSLISLNAFLILKNTLGLIKTNFKEKKLNITIESKYDEFYVNANELLVDIFENILINAIKYNDKEIIEILIRITTIMQNKTNYYKLEFLDNGIGVIDSKKELIFNRGFKEEKGTKGLGIGLSLIIKILKMYKGKIWVEDKVQGDYSKGSNFIVLLPKIKIDK